MVILLWCSSSLNRPDSTRASYSAIGPWVLPGSGESVVISACPRKLECLHIHSCATCANPRWLNTGACRMPRSRTGLAPARSIAVLPPLLRFRAQSIHIVLLEKALAFGPFRSTRRGAAIRGRLRSARRASDDVIFEVCKAHNKKRKSGYIIAIIAPRRKYDQVKKLVCKLPIVKHVRATKVLSV